MKKSIIVLLVVSLLAGLVSCNDGSVDERLFKKEHEHVFSVLPDGTWECTYERCNEIIDLTDAPYFAIIGSDGLPGPIVPLTGNYKSQTIKGLSFVDSFVSYQSYEGNTVYLRTTEDFTISIDAENATVYHYGKADVVLLEAVADKSYHLNGKVSDLVVKKGNVVLDNGSSIEDLAVAKTANGSAITIQKADNATIEVLAVYTDGQASSQEKTVTVNGKAVEAPETKAIIGNGTGVVTITKDLDNEIFRVKTQLFTSIEEAKATASELAAPIRVVNNTTTTSTTKIEKNEVVIISVDVAVTVPVADETNTGIAVDKDGTLEVYGSVANKNTIKNEGIIKNFNSIATKATDTETASVIENNSVVKNYGTLSAEAGKIQANGKDSTIENFGTLTVEKDASLEVAKNAKVENKTEGSIENKGTIKTEGTFENSGSVTVAPEAKLEVTETAKVTNTTEGTIENKGTITNNGKIEDSGKIVNDETTGKVEGEGEFKTSEGSSQDTNIYVAEIGDKKYVSLETAITAVKETETIKLLDNIVLDKPILLAHNVALDLNGKNITVDAKKWPTTGNHRKGLFIVSAGVKLTVNDTGENGSIDGSASPNAYSAVYMTDPDVTETETTQIAELVVNGGTLKGYYAGIYTLGHHEKTKITINGGTFTGESADGGIAIYHPNKGSLTINGGTFKGYDGLDIKGGTPVTINGGTFIATGKKVTPTAAGTSGTNNVGSALYVEGNYGHGAQVIINGGTFTTTDKDAPAVRSLFNEESVSTISIKGGTFSSDPTEYVAENYIANEDKTNKVWTVEENFVAAIGGQEYHTIKEAIGASKDNDEIRILKDCTETGLLTFPSGKNLTLNLNGKNVTANGDATGHWAYVEGNLTVKGSGYLGDTTHEKTGFIFYVFGTLTIEGEAKYESGLEVAEMRSAGSKLYVHGGTFIGDVHDGRYWTFNKLDAHKDTSTIEIDGGTFENFNPSNANTENPVQDWVKSGFVSVKIQDKTDNEPEVWTVKSLFASGNGTKESPFMITCREDFMKIGQLYDSGKDTYFEVDPTSKKWTSIDSDGHPHMDASNWCPNDNTDGLFMFGSIDCKDLIIDNLDQPLFRRVGNTASANGKALEDYELQNSYIKNLTINACNISGEYGVAAVIRDCEVAHMTLENVKVTGLIEVHNTHGGSFIAYGAGNRDDNAPNYNTGDVTFINCFSYCEIVGSECGGFVGYWGTNTGPSKIIIKDSDFLGTIRSYKAGKFIQGYTGAPGYLEVKNSQGFEITGAENTTITMDTNAKNFVTVTAGPQLTYQNGGISWDSAEEGGKIVVFVRVSYDASIFTNSELKELDSDATSYTLQYTNFSIGSGSAEKTFYIANAKNKFNKAEAFVNFYDANGDLKKTSSYVVSPEPK